ncbi:MAG TPA: hypothetical protein DEF51_46970 [Myxococcales bacterium]|nr:hypothetical protein [Myxococcales bacterium]
MYAARCPECGRPGPVQLAAPDRFACGACGYRGAPPGQASAQLREAASILTRTDARRRQLSTFQRRLLTSDLFGTLVYLAACAAVLLPFAGCFALSAFTPGGPVDWAALLMCATPVLVVLTFGASGLLFLRSRLARVRAQLAAFPPPTPGAPAACHVCGGPLAATSDAAFVRCAFCRADNLVSPRVLAALGDARARVLEDFTGEVGRRSAIARQAFRSALRGLGLGALVAAPLACCLGASVFSVMNNIETEPYEDAEYALVDAPAGRCVTRVRGLVGGNVSLVTGDWARGASVTTRRPRAEVPVFRAAALAGMRVRHEGREARVARITGTGGTGENRLHLEGAPRAVPVQDVCLADGAPSPAPPIPVRHRR